MGDPHNPARYGELWPQYKIDAYLEALLPFQSLVVFSGGWAWHFMSPKGHPEYKHAHDHKDADWMVPPSNVGTVVGMLKGRGFNKVHTRFDRLPSEEEFRRYEKVMDDGVNPPFRITIDFFVRDVPVRVIDGWMVVEPVILLTFYSTFHSSKACFAVQAAKRLLDAGIDPQGRPELVEIPAQ
jgi:hypothetical protein